MRRHTLLLFIALIVAKTCFSQHQQIRSRVHVYVKNLPGDSVLLMADDDLIIPVKLILDFTLVNLNSNNKPFTITIPAKTVGKVLSVWKPIDVGSNYKWTFTWSTSLSDSSKYLNLKNYYLPFFFKHSSIKLTQKPGGIFSHKGVFAYDFAMRG